MNGGPFRDGHGDPPVKPKNVRARRIAFALGWSYAAAFVVVRLVNVRGEVAVWSWLAALAVLIGLAWYRIGKPANG